MLDLLKGILKFILKFVLICAVISIFLLVFLGIVFQLPEGVQYIVTIASAITVVILLLAWIMKRS